MNAFATNQLKYAADELLKNFSSAALLHEDQTIALKYETPSDLGTLPFAASVTAKFFALKENDAIILNDPYSGGSSLNTLTLITKSFGDWTLVTRTRWKPKLELAQKLDQEGLRIPPTPIAQSGSLNEAIVTAISSHPQCPPDFVFQLKSLWHLTQTQLEQIKKLAQAHSSVFEKANVKNYLKLEKESLLAKIDELPHGENKKEYKFITGETVKLNLKLHSQGLELDFSNSSPAHKWGLTEADILGAGASALICYLGAETTVSSSLLSLINVITSPGSIVNCKFPTPTLRGVYQNLPIITSLVLDSLAKLSRQNTQALSLPSSVMIDLRFQNQLQFLDCLSNSQQWSRRNSRSSVQQIEQLYPLRVLQISFRKSGPHRTKTFSREYEVLESCDLRWIFSSGVEIKINGQELLTANEGLLKLNAGQKVWVGY